ncbi:hypothetical protein DB30_05028 [Enhygromyxa salina]|uniref:HIRAN domain-containing protein n=1 Tax=Enhygromyxa salina TaxID=215803 RepID=A0A0C1ZE71_9BACT|nr:hypothetical protein DB30_05028 [Enhygromyxa salina]
MQNSYNHRALLLRSDDNVNLGYVPDLLVDDLASLDLSPENFKVTVSQVNPRPSPIGHRVLCHVQLRWPDGRKPFMSERFAPLG